MDIFLAAIDFPCSPLSSRFNAAVARIEMARHCIPPSLKRIVLKCNSHSLTQPPQGNAHYEINVSFEATMPGSYKSKPNTSAE